MVPGILPSQLEILSMGQTYFDTLKLLTYTFIWKVQKTLENQLSGAYQKKVSLL